MVNTTTVVNSIMARGKQNYENNKKENRMFFGYPLVYSRTIYVLFNSENAFTVCALCCHRTAVTRGRERSA